ncbi:hypothetical protein HRR83_005478 [Exophiala dermatitidis]|uniref:Uncharacterized protein n=1 Tax=Exophiala dermatitidis TaxID=5970 RepID=A0AAN6EWJ9_EXODE|nr:hypothetical protein HRR74_005331 [Exophiala dermatitidis]KAJ4518420.1 hypothetical protein HRR73_004001 [Exophiala dermatitidis]KAJ4533914.1 hypothetical protein HRR76_005865 [Exophiala dermatitidis]KAJ4550071.1 hypothetical protein HRR77_003551 [Exophiala dermatitidis]KAJ4553418.1 hypothetical protein HRR79_009611 [Exophiala dermatitidis]
MQTLDCPSVSLSVALDSCTVQDKVYTPELLWSSRAENAESTNEFQVRRRLFSGRASLVRHSSHDGRPDLILVPNIPFALKSELCIGQGIGKPNTSTSTSL